MNAVAIFVLAILVVCICLCFIRVHQRFITIECKIEVLEELLVEQIKESNEVEHFKDFINRKVTEK